MEVRLEDLFCKGLEIYAEGLFDRGHRRHTFDPSAFLRLRMGLRFSTYPEDQLHRVNRFIESHECHCPASAHSVPKGLVGMASASSMRQDRKRTTGHLQLRSFKRAFLILVRLQAGEFSLDLGLDVAIIRVLILIALESPRSFHTLSCQISKSPPGHAFFEAQPT